MRILAFVFALTAAALLSGLSSTTQAKPLVIRQGFAVPDATMSPLIFSAPQALGLKYYGKTYVVEPVHFAGTSPELTALATGEINLVTIAYSTLPIAVENAHISDLRVVADGEEDGIDGYFSSPYLVRNDSGIKSVRDLRGKVIGVNAIGDAVDIAMRAMLLKHHLIASRDYTIVESPFPTLGPMLLGRKVSLIGDVPPFIFNPKLKSAARVLFTMKDAIGPSQLIMLAARESFLEHHRKALNDFFEDLVRGTRWMLAPAHRKEALTIAARFAKLPVKRLSGYYLTRDDRYRSPDCIPNVTVLQRNIETERRLGFLKANFNAERYVDLDFVKRAVRRLDGR